MGSSKPSSTSNCYQIEGRYVRPLRTPKFKTKGVVLQSNGREFEIYLPKKLRMLLAIEIQPGDELRVLAEEKKDKIVAINVMKTAGAIASSPIISAPPRLASVPDWSEAKIAGDRADKKQVVKICRKGTCRKRGSLDLLKQWQAEADRDPQLAGFECQLTSCLKRCKQGVNVQVGKRIVSNAQKSSLAEVAGVAEPEKRRA